MQAVILAAGEGKRLRPLTLETPKPLLKINGQPILEHTFQNLPDQVKEIILVVGYKGDQIKNYFGNQFGGRRLYYVEQPEPNGTFHALARAKSFLNDEQFLVLVGDDLYKKEDLERLARHSISVLVYETATPDRFGICKIKEGDWLDEIIEKPAYPCGNLAYTGASILTRSIFEEPVVYGANGEELLSFMIGSLSKKEPTKAVRASFWFPIGYPEDLRKAEEELK